MAPKVKFDPKKFSHTFIGKRVTRWLHKFLDSIGRDNLLYAIENDKDLLSYIPPEQVYSWIHLIPIDKESVDQFTNDEVYSWVPDEYKGIIESHDKGKDWFNSQVESIRSRIASS